MEERETSTWTLTQEKETHSGFQISESSKQLYVLQQTEALFDQRIMYKAVLLSYKDNFTSETKQPFSWKIKGLLIQKLEVSNHLLDNYKS